MPGRQAARRPIRAARAARPTPGPWPGYRAPWCPARVPWPGPPWCPSRAPWCAPGGPPWCAPWPVFASTCKPSRRAELAEPPGRAGRAAGPSWPGRRAELAELAGPSWPSWPGQGRPGARSLVPEPPPPGRAPGARTRPPAPGPRPPAPGPRPPGARKTGPGAGCAGFSPISHARFHVKHFLRSKGKRAPFVNKVNSCQNICNFKTKRTP